MPGLTLETEALSSETAVVAVAGEIDMYTAPTLERELASAFASGAQRVVVDLRKCEFLDSSALGVLLASRAALQEDAGELVLVVADRSILKVFEITGLDQTFTIERSLPHPHPRSLSE